MSVKEDLKRPFQTGNVLMQIIIINIAVFLLLNVFRIVFFFSGYQGDALDMKFTLSVGQYVSMPMLMDWFIYRPWTILTYFFAQVGVGHLFWNMLALYFFGSILQNLIGYGKTLAIYVYSGIVGGLLTLLMHSTIPVLYENASLLIGASGSVMGMVVATVTLVPNQRIMLLFFGEIKLIYLALIYIALDFIGITYIDGVGHICHLGGALAGYLFMISLKNGKDLSKGFNKLFYGITGIFKPRKSIKAKVVKNTYQTKSTTTKSSAPNKEDVQRKVDAILDKISKGGYESLTKEEKEYLFTHGKNV